MCTWRRFERKGGGQAVPGGLLVALGQGAAGEPLRGAAPGLSDSVFQHIFFLRANTAPVHLKAR
eukprot:790897-Alexandrium_andersonii.AAC.1